MKNTIIMSTRFVTMLGLACCLAFSTLLTSCKEEIDESNFAIKTDQTILDYITAAPELSSIKAIFDRVRMGKTENASSISSVLSARGNYTVFAPNNDAVSRYVFAMTQSYDVNALSYEQAELVAKSCIIDNGDNEAYETADFPMTGESFPLSNLNDRRLTSQSVDNNFVINGNAWVTQGNIDVSNGVLHVVSEVIAPSNDFLPDLIAQAPNLSIMSRLINETGWADKMKEYIDNVYETNNLLYAGTTKRFADFNFPYMTKRAIGYTAFVETNTAFQNDWGVPAPQFDGAGNITNWSAIFSVINAKCVEHFGNSSVADLKNEDNPVNQFVAYHLLRGNMAPDEFVHHYNEWSYSYGADKLRPQTTKLPTDVWDYYTTMGKHRGLLKITQLSDTPCEGEAQGYYLNRISEYANGIPHTSVESTDSYNYQELSTKPNAPGQNGINIKVNVQNGSYDNNSLNGFYYPIDHILLYNQETRDLLASQRIRVDLVTMLPELFDNDVRGQKVYYFPNGYFENITNESSVTQIYYLQEGRVAHNGSWKDYQGDEFLFSGKYDFVLKLPPVPKTGSYELRMGFSMNSLRGMVQVYLVTSPDQTTPVSLPIDLRESVSQIPGQPWVDDAECVSVADIIENDRNLRNQNYMKAPQYMCVSGEQNSCRNASPATPALRRILCTETLSKDKTYYLRFKSVMESSETQFMMDYFEFVPTEIVNNPTNPEDIW